MTELFKANTFYHENLLPCDGEVVYSEFYSDIEAKKYFDILQESIQWEHDRIFMFGKWITTKRTVAWYGDKPFQYTYSKSTKTALYWTDTLREIKKKLEQETGEKFNSCLLNYYHSGDEGMSWHSDNEKEIVSKSTIATISLGAERKFSFRHKDFKKDKPKLTLKIDLKNGSLLLMRGEIQEFWQHQLPVSKKVKGARISLTFRRIVE